MREHDTSRVSGGAAARDWLTRIRSIYFGVSPKIRLVAAIGILVVVGAAAIVLHGDLFGVLATAAIVIALVAGGMRNPSVFVTGLIALGWLYVCLLLIVPWAGGALYIPFLLVVLALPVGVVAHRIKRLTPWKTALFALFWAALLGIGVVHVIAPLVVPAVWGAAAVVCGWRWVASRRMPVTGTAASPWAQGQRERAYGRDYGSEAADGEQWEEPPPISVDEALSELENMIGLEPVKDQVRSIAASIEAARMRADAGYSTDKPMRHFVFVGPPGTGKTTVARILGKIFYAYGLLATPYVVETQRADLVGEYLGATAIKTNEVVDRALGGVLFVDEAYSLVNAGEGQPDRFGNEAVQTLLKRAEDDREHVVIILAGYEKEMEGFLASNPGLSSRFATRVRFPSYQPGELLQIAEYTLAQRGDALEPDARPELWREFEDVWRRDILDELGNGRFVRSLVENASQARDVRVVTSGSEPSSEDLVTVRAEDVELAYRQLTARHRDYAEAPTVEDALGELDRMVGLEPVKRQVRSIVAQLRVAKMRQAQGLVTQAPMRHFVFVGPPGTGKTTVARILGRVFAALGLLARPNVIEAQRADLVGEHLGSTAMKTNKLIDSAVGGVLFIDEAYSLANEGYTGGDPYGSEAVQTLLKRAEDDRDRLVVVLAGYPNDMDRFLATNPGLASRFGVRVAFPSYQPDELCEISVSMAGEAGDTFEPAALDDLRQIFDYVCSEGWIDELGNGRFARSLFEKACSYRDMRVADLGAHATAAQLTTVISDDVRGAYQDLAARVQ